MMYFMRPQPPGRAFGSWSTNDQQGPDCDALRSSAHGGATRALGGKRITGIQNVFGI